MDKIIIDTSDSFTDLCTLGIEYPTDKCPYNQDSNLHKHPYTPIYNLLFSTFRYNDIKFAEIGIFNNNSMKSWREYFPKAKLFGFDNDNNLLSVAKSHDLFDTTYKYMDVSDADNIHKTLEGCGSNFDVILDDSSHEFEHQINIIKSSIPHTKAGGYIIIEDIFRKEKEIRYDEALYEYQKYFSYATFIVAEHNLRNSFGWDNDKLLIIQRNDFKFKP